MGLGITGRPIGVLPPILVRPLPELSGVTQEALRAVAEHAKKIDAHYRFFCYSDVPKVTDASQKAPTAGWPAAGADWAAGTIGAVCSSFVWAAVQAANPDVIASGKPRIELEGEVEPEDKRQSVEGFDALYVYTEDERNKAGKALYDFTHNRVMKELDKAVPEFLSAVLDLLPGAPDVKEYVANVVANQLCNVFAKDHANDLLNTWSNPGDGKAVSPDDTMLRWDVRTAPPNLPTTKMNIYGRATRCAIPEPGWISEPICEVRPSNGIGNLRGKVVRRDAPNLPPHSAIGAVVRFGCDSTVNSLFHSGIGDIRALTEGFELISMKAGRYLLQASDIIVDPNTNIGLEWKSKPQDITLRNGDDLTNVILELLPPPGVARTVDVRSHHDIVDRVVVGKDRWGHPDMNGRIRLAFDPRDNPAAPPDQRNTRTSDKFDQTTPEVGSGVHVRVIVDANLQSVVAANGTTMFDGSVSCNLKIIFFDASEGETNDTVAFNNIILGAGENVSKSYNSVSSDTVPERASGTVTITNQVTALP